MLVPSFWIIYIKKPQKLALHCALLQSRIFQSDWMWTGLKTNNPRKTPWGVPLEWQICVFLPLFSQRPPGPRDTKRCLSKWQTCLPRHLDVYARSTGTEGWKQGGRSRGLKQIGQRYFDSARKVMERWVMEIVERWSEIGGRKPGRWLLGPLLLQTPWQPSAD